MRALTPGPLKIDMNVIVMKLPPCLYISQGPELPWCHEAAGPELKAPSGFKMLEDGASPHRSNKFAPPYV